MLRKGNAAFRVIVYFRFLASNKLVYVVSSIHEKLGNTKVVQNHEAQLEAGPKV